MKAEKISIEKAKKDKLFYFVSNVITYRESDGRCLILKRSETENAHPGKWAVTGGKLEHKDLDLNNPTRINEDVIDFEDAAEDLLIRETKEEANIELHKDFKYINSVAFVRTDGIPVIMIKFAAKYKSGNVKPEEGAFTDFAWVNAEEVNEYDCIQGVKEEIEKVIEMFK